MLRTALIVLAAVFLTACATGSSDRAACPDLAHYSAAAQRAAAEALEALPEGSPLAPMLGDYAALRAAVRACRGE